MPGALGEVGPLAPPGLPWVGPLFGVITLGLRRFTCDEARRIASNIGKKPELQMRLKSRYFAGKQCHHTARYFRRLEARIVGIVSCALASALL